LGDAEVALPGVGDELVEEGEERGEGGGGGVGLSPRGGGEEGEGEDGASCG
jgi:hypothetical protein